MKNIATALVPPAFDERVWKETPSAKAPNFYRGTQFDFSILLRYVRFSEEAGTVRLFRTEVAALSVSNPNDSTNTPIIFRLRGRRFMYRFLIWSDRVVIEMHGEPIRRVTLRRVIFPTREESLRLALHTVRGDLVRK